MSKEMADDKTFELVGDVAVRVIARIAPRRRIVTTDDLTDNEYDLLLRDAATAYQNRIH